MTSRTSADLPGSIIKVVGRNLASQVIDGNTVNLQDSSSTWKSFTVLSRNIVQTDTNVVLQKTSLQLFQPNGSSPTMRYTRIVNAEAITVNAGGPPYTATFNWTEPTFQDAIFPLGPDQHLKVINAAVPGTVYDSSGASPHNITTLTITSDKQVTITFGEPLNTNPLFLTTGQVQIYYNVEVPLYTTVVPDPVKLCSALFTTSFNYALTGSPGLVPQPPHNITNPFPYSVWFVPSGWTGTYAELKNLYSLVLNGSATSAQLGYVTDKLNMTLAAFNRMMTLLKSCEDYLAAMYTSTAPSSDDLYELASVIRNCAKPQLRDTWVKEEIRHADDTASHKPILLQLTGEFFWKALTEPVSGAWDPSLQTVPASSTDVTATTVPIIDPELLSDNDMLSNPEAAPYRALRTARKSTLDTKNTNFLTLVSIVPYDPDGYTKIMNAVNTNSSGLPYNISPYATLQDLLIDLNSGDVFTHKAAADVVWSAFRMSSDDFLTMTNTKSRFESGNPALMPNDAENQKAVKLLVSAYKRKQLYGNGTNSSGTPADWLYEEMHGSFTGGGGARIMYYNVIPMRLPVGRSDAADRLEWQNTLAAWNRIPTLQPDIVPPENLKSFTSTDPVFVEWDSRRLSLINDYDYIAANYINSTMSGATLLSNLKKQIDLIIARVPSYDHSVLGSSNDYLSYFTALADKETAGEDIRPYLDQFGISISEYRYLVNIMNVMTLAGSGTNPLVASEYDDVINILIAIHSRNLTYDQVMWEYSHIVLDQRYFQIYVPAPVSFPANELPVYNQWRSPYQLRRAWADTLQARIDRTQAVTDAWSAALEKADDLNMPFLRDALIKALTPVDQNWQDMAEQLAKTYFVETKDNCCVKHTRVSFAIECLQGFLFSLKNGIFDDFVSDYKLSAPHFDEEWKWIGSYSTWRSAEFVFTYPENLLYPTLKRLQTPAFVNLASSISSASTLSPRDACRLAADYETYYNDIQNLQIASTASVRQLPDNSAPGDCCNSSTSWPITVTYYFAQGPSGAIYYTYVNIEDTLNEIRGWKKIELENHEGISIVSSHVIGSRAGVSWSLIDCSIYLFFSYPDGNSLKLGYISLDIEKGNTSSWSGEKLASTVPSINDSATNSTYYVSAITGCQSRWDTDSPVFVFTFSTSTANLDKVYMPYYYFLGSDTYSPWIMNNPAGVTLADGLKTSQNLITAIKHYAVNSPANSYGVVTMVFDSFAYPLLYRQAIQPGSAGNLPTNQPITNLPSSIRIIGAYELPHQTSNDYTQLVIVYNEPATSITCSIKNMQVVWDQTNNLVKFNLLTDLTPTINFNNINHIYPIYSEKDADRGFAVKYGTQGYLLSCRLYINGSSIDTVVPGVTDTNGSLIVYPGYPQRLTIQTTAPVSVQSADCVGDMNMRALNIKTNVIANQTPIAGIRNPQILTETLYEAYYFVPMLLALDQHSRGQYESALSWYRTVYDYTQYFDAAANGANRKIFYGLVLEDAPSTYEQANNWLQDPLNPHLIAKTRRNAYTKYTLMNIIQCMYAYADQQFTLDTIETVPLARILYSTGLELLNVPDLEMQQNECISMASNGINSRITNPVPQAWRAQVSQLSQGLAAVGNTGSISHIINVDHITNLINSATEDTYGTNFAAAFDLVNGATAADTHDTMLDVLSGQAARINEAYQYVSAANPTTEYNSMVGAHYATDVAGISGVALTAVNNPGSASQVSWIGQPVPPNNQPYQFTFANSSGVQALPGNQGYNPLQPMMLPYSINSSYSNPSYAIGNEQSSLPVNYTPLLNYYFCIPQNPVYDSLQLKGNVELYKIFNCRNIAGMVRELDVFSAATDSTTGLPVIGASGNLVLPATGSFSPSQYRFSTLIDRAKQINAQAQQLEALFLAALEKKDAANYELLNAKQGLASAQANIQLQDLRVLQSTDEESIANTQLDKANYSLSFYS